MMAIQAIDKERAVAAMDTVRSLLERYRPRASRRRLARAAPPQCDSVSARDD
ncbi:hypothetical protein I553_10072 [Mycobacterium xenopi 4042]|uniref:Uncharacterized protein n=1 Tax=Mycobacterium xenopi 4042 TaxID=1299334 RepID=X7YRH7_MYCXE|nr:hypothetical protein I553_10072 [Mycobacterium xenopi 4042]